MIALTCWGRGYRMGIDMVRSMYSRVMMMMVPWGNPDNLH